MDNSQSSELFFNNGDHSCESSIMVYFPSTWLLFRSFLKQCVLTYVNNVFPDGYNLIQSIVIKHEAVFI